MIAADLQLNGLVKKLDMNDAIDKVCLPPPEMERKNNKSSIK